MYKGRAGNETFTSSHRYCASLVDSQSKDMQKGNGKNGVVQDIHVIHVYVLLKQHRAFHLPINIPAFLLLGL